METRLDLEHPNLVIWPLEDHIAIGSWLPLPVAELDQYKENERGYIEYLQSAFEKIGLRVSEVRWYGTTPGPASAIPSHESVGWKFTISRGD